MWRQHLPFLLHALVETPAALSFILVPQRQLPGATPEAELLLASYGGALLATVGVCAVFLLRDAAAVDDGTARAVGLALAVYHLFPIRRAVRRIGDGRAAGRPAAATLGGPWVHLVLHAACFASLLGLGLAAPAASSAAGDRRLR